MGAVQPAGKAEVEFRLPQVHCCSALAGRVPRDKSKLYTSVSRCPEVASSISLTAFGIKTTLELGRVKTTIGCNERRQDPTIGGVIFPLCCS